MFPDFRLAPGVWPLVLVSSFSNQVLAQSPADPHHDRKIEEVIVTGQVDKTRAETALPVSVISGEALRKVAQSNLGDTLKSQPGVQSTSFGSGVGRPIIRGQSGNRVRVLQGGLNTLDASSVSPDHANGVSALAAERIEVIRGPATLLYGNGAVGGVVNVIDNRIPQSPIESPRLIIDQSHNTNNDQDTTQALFEAASGNWQWHIDGNYYESNLVEIPDDALIGEAAEEGEELRSGVIGNSNTEGSNLTLGNSYIGDRFNLGWSINQIDSEYGLPPGVHGHEEEGEGGEEEEEVDVRIDLEQTRYELKGQLELDGFLTQIDGQIAYTDYEHQEIEIELEEAHEGEGEGEEEEEDHEGTVFSNEGFDARLKAKHQPIAGWNGIIGLQWQEREFGAEGEEAYIGFTDISSQALFALESLEQGDWIFEVGARLENNNAELTGGCDQSQTTISASSSALRHLNEQSNVWLSLSYSERAATEEELFSNVDGSACQALPDDELVEHVATGQIEVGDPDLDKEISQNIELGWRKHQGRWQAEVNLYLNQVDDYIYLAETGADEVVAYTQRDAQFIGTEAHFSTHLLKTDYGHLDLGLTGDWVQAEFSNGDNLPRLAPARLGLELGWSASQWSASISAREVLEQDNTAEGETSTDGYTLVQAYADYHLQVGKLDWAFYLRGSNLLDEDIRDHTSFIKEAAPAPGRAVEFGTRLTF